MRKYKDTTYCEVCDKETLHLFIDSEHERDSSNDSKECLECNSYYDGWGKLIAKGSNDAGN